MRRLPLLVVVAGILGLSCTSSNSNGTDPGATPDVVADPGSPADPGTLPDVAAESGVDTITGATKLILTEVTHAAWNDPRCWNSGCHTADTHNDGKDPYMCIGCHGIQGAAAKPGHTDRGTPCGKSGCHSPLPHGTDGFPDPLSCKACHPGVFSGG